MIDTIDVMCATACVILALSLIIQAILEVLKRRLHLKSGSVRKELTVLFDAEEADQPRLRRRIGRRSTLAGQLVTDLEKTLRRFGLTDLGIVEELDAAKLRKILQSLPSARELHETARMKRILERIDCWFEISKEASRARYLSTIRRWSYVTGGIIVMILDANLAGIYNEFTTGKAVKETLVAAAPAMITSGVRGVAADGTLRPGDIAATVATITAERSFHMLRWNTTTGDVIRTNDVATFMADFGRAAVRNWPGWLAMAILASLGAPFWYDVLKMLMGVRERLKSRSGDLLPDDASSAGTDTGETGG
jgi:hypothetical protein